jgi:ATP-binding cassette subfamily F protein uup
VLEGDGEVRCYPGGHADYEAQSAARRAAAKEAASAADKCVSVPRAAPAAGAKKLGFNEQRELAALPGLIEKMEGELAEIRELLSDGLLFRNDPARATELNNRLPMLEIELEKAVDRWAELEERR